MKNRNTIITTEELKQWLLSYLTETFGDQFLNLITPPDGVETGERVMFKLREGVKAERHEVTPQEAEDFHRSLVESMPGIKIHTEPPLSSGLPYPRMVDITDWSIAYDNPAKEYLTSDTLLPKDDFNIDWLLGVVFSSERRFVYIDFTHPKVKAIFSFVYDDESIHTKSHLVYPQLKEFKETYLSYIKEAADSNDLLWIKLVQIDETILTQKKARD